MLVVLAIHLALAFPDAPPIALAVMRAAADEAAAIWAPYGVTLEPIDPCGHGIAVGVVDVDIVRGRGLARVPAVLGTIVFGADGIPAERVSVFLDEILAFAESTRVFNAHAWQWPQRLHEQIIGRIMGRVIAHEIGHYVLRSRGHSPAGLMRSSQRSDDMAAPSRAGFKLSGEDVTQLARELR